jgi:hypothetical protein
MTRVWINLPPLHPPHREMMIKELLRSLLREVEWMRKPRRRSARSRTGWTTSIRCWERSMKLSLVETVESLLMMYHS